MFPSNIYDEIVPSSHLVSQASWTWMKNIHVKAMRVNISDFYEPNKAIFVILAIFGICVGLSANTSLKENRNMGFPVILS